MMKKFKEIVYTINRTITPLCFGISISQLLNGNYKLASWFLFAITILLMISYFTEVCSK